MIFQIKQGITKVDIDYYLKCLEQIRGHQLL